MTVKDLICDVLRIVGRDDAADAIEADGELSAEVARLQRACLTYFNSVVDELARGYFPLYDFKSLTSTNTVYSYDELMEEPIEFIKITDADGNAVKWVQGIHCLFIYSKTANIYYRYAFTPCKTTDLYVYPVHNVSARLVEYGMLAEYYLVLGDATNSAAWENKYRLEIENLLSKSTVRDKIPPRRWI